MAENKNRRIGGRTLEVVLQTLIKTNKRVFEGLEVDRNPIFNEKGEFFFFSFKIGEETVKVDWVYSEEGELDYTGTVIPYLIAFRKKLNSISFEGDVEKALKEALLKSVDAWCDSYNID